MLAAIILAAGESTRMGRPKALLSDLAGRPFVARVVRTFAEASIRDVIVVTGSQHVAIVEAIAADGPPVTPVFVVNTEPLARATRVSPERTRCGRGAGC